MAQAHYDTYRDQLGSLYHGHALWEPDPAQLYDQVRVGDVGYVKRGHFFRMFNILLQADDTAQVYGVPEGFVRLNMGPFHNVCTLNLPQGDYCSDTVTVDHRDERQAGGPDEPTSALFKCRRNNKGGAFLSLPFNGESKDAIRTKAFETYIRKHCDSWIEFAVTNDLDIRLEDIILVTGCDLTSSWAMAAFTKPLDPEITLHVQASEANGSAGFQWSHTNQPHHNEPNQNTEKSHCVFIRGFRAKRILPFFKTLKAAAEPRPDNPNDEPESSIELLREPTLPDYRDPLMGILDYIAEQRPNDDIALAHEDDLKKVKGVDVLTADAVENFLRQNKTLVQTEEGFAFLADKDEEEVPEEEKMTFHALANVGDESLPLIVHPVLMKYLLKFDITQPLDHDFGLPKEDFFSSAVYPPVHVLILENEQGLPQNIEVQASDKRSGIGVSVGDVLKAIGADLRKSSSQCEWAALNEDVRREVEDATEEEKSGCFKRISYLRGRNRLQVFPRQPFSEEEEELVQPLTPYIQEEDELVRTPHTRTSDLFEGAGPISQPYALPYITPHPLTARVYLHTALAAPGLQYDMRHPPNHSNPHLLPAVLAEPASNPPLASLSIRVAGLPWQCTVRPDPKRSPGNAAVTVQDVFVCLYYHLRTQVKADEYNAMDKGRKTEIFQTFERRVGHDPVQRGKGLRRVDFLRGHIIAQGLVRAQSKDDVWEVVVR